MYKCISTSIQSNIRFTPVAARYTVRTRTHDFQTQFLIINRMVPFLSWHRAPVLSLRPVSKAGLGPWPHPRAQPCLSPCHLYPLTFLRCCEAVGSRPKWRAISARERKRLPSGAYQYASSWPADEPALRTSVLTVHPATSDASPPEATRYAMSASRASPFAARLLDSTAIFLGGSAALEPPPPSAARPMAVARPVLVSGAVLGGAPSSHASIPGRFLGARRTCRSAI